MILGLLNTAPATPATVTGTAAAMVYGMTGTVSVKVVPATATGTVTVSQGGVVLGSTTLAAGAGTVALAAKSLPAGTYTLALTYSGDATHKASTGTASLLVSKAKPTVKAKTKPKKVVVKKTRVKVVVKVAAEGYTPTGKVKIRVAGKTYRARVVDGKAVIKLKAFKRPGKYKAKVSYAGDANTETARTRVAIRVKRS